MLSFRTRQTGGDGYIVLKQLQQFLVTDVTSSFGDENDDNYLSSGRRELNNLKTETYYNVANRLKKILLNAFNFYTGIHISAEMKQALLVKTSIKLLINRSTFIFYMVHFYLARISPIIIIQVAFSLLIIIIKISLIYH